VLIDGELARACVVSTSDVVGRSVTTIEGTLARYRVPRMTDAPPIEIVVLDRPDLASAGAGETPTRTTSPGGEGRTKVLLPRRRTRSSGTLTILRVARHQVRRGT